MKNIKSKVLSFAIVLFLLLSFGSLNTSIAQAVEAQPVCTLEQISGRTIVDLTPYNGLRSDSDEAAATGGPFATVLVAGTYDVTLQSYDNHTEKNQIQPNEQWYLILKDIGDSTIATTSAISDLPDDIDNLTEIVDTNFVLTSSVTSATTYHDAYPDSTSANSIRPVCAAFDLVLPPTATIEAVKIICPTEDLLPNWGAGGEDITSDTASAFLEANPTCYTEDWTFEWAPDSTVNPGNQTETGGEDWTALIWVREQFNSDYISFSGDTTEPRDEDVSAEFYCSNDVLNYDNYDFIDPVEADQTYYCVGFNAPIEQPTTNPQCSDDVDNDGDELIDSASYVPSDNDETDEDDDGGGGGGGGSGSHTRCSDKKDNDDDGLVDSADPGCHSDGNASNADSYVPSDSDEQNGGQVLGAQTSCGIYVDKYLRRGYKNDAEAVKKVQLFLNDYLKLKLEVDGIYGSKTEEAVRVFQILHKDKILTPWGVTASTGIFYLTTQTEVNNIMCPDLNLQIPSNLINFTASMIN
ncbi:MAG: Shell matrix protein [Candidatus Nomurabacteria bacterium GW2011_GWC2_35_35]|nr:MAG: Shell matrix protein [Candidatus Nomurabacteria bacterium GW2011_GWC2_35_35]